MCREAILVDVELRGRGCGEKGQKRNASRFLKESDKDHRIQNAWPRGMKTWAK